MRPIVTCLCPRCRRARLEQRRLGANGGGHRACSTARSSPWTTGSRSPRRWRSRASASSRSAATPRSRSTRGRRTRVVDLDRSHRHPRADRQPRALHARRRILASRSAARRHHLAQRSARADQGEGGRIQAGRMGGGARGLVGRAVHRRTARLQPGRSSTASRRTIRWRSSCSTFASTPTPRRSRQWASSRPRPIRAGSRSRRTRRAS